MLSDVSVTAGINDDVFSVVRVGVNYISIFIIFRIGGKQAHLFIADADVSLGRGYSGVFSVAYFVCVKKYFVGGFLRRRGCFLWGVGRIVSRGFVLRQHRDDCFVFG